MNNIKGKIFMTQTLPSGKEIKLSKTNTLTSLFENTILATAIGGLFSSNMASEAGVSSVNTPQRYTLSSTGVKLTSDSPIDSFVIYLLNLPPADLSLLTKNISKNPILDSQGNLIDSKVVGWATFNYIGEDAKRGVLTPQKSIYTMDHELYGVSFNWGAGKLNGTVNCIMIGSNVIENKRSAITLSKGLDVNNPAINEAPADGHYLTNNVSLGDGTVITGPNEILLGNGNNATVARRVLNLLTGESEELESTDIRYGAYLFNIPHAYIGEGRIVQNAGSVVSVVNYNKTNTSLNKSLVSSNARGFAIANNNIYVHNASSTSSPYLQVFDMETLSTSSSNNIPLTFPSDMSTVRNWDLTNYMNKFMFINTAGGVSTYPSTGNEGFIFSNINDPFNSYEGGYVGFIGSNIELMDENEAIVDYLYLTEYQISNFKKGVNSDNVFNAGGTTTSVARNGIKYVAPTYNGQVLTYSVLDAPLNFTGIENFRIDYTFNF